MRALLNRFLNYILRLSPKITSLFSIPLGIHLEARGKSRNTRNRMTIPSYFSTPSRLNLNAHCALKREVIFGQSLNHSFIGSMCLNLKLTTIDIKNAAMITLSCAIATISSRWFTLPDLIWAMIIAALLPFSKFGVIRQKNDISA